MRTRSSKSGIERLRYLKAVLRELYGLFVDDNRFAIAIIVWLALPSLARPHLHLSGTWSTALLFAGLVAILIECALRGARRRTTFASEWLGSI